MKVPLSFPQRLGPYRSHRSGKKPEKGQLRGAAVVSIRRVEGSLSGFGTTALWGLNVTELLTVAWEGGSIRDKEREREDYRMKFVLKFEDGPGERRKT